MIAVTNAYSTDINVRYRFRMIYSFLFFCRCCSDYEIPKMHFIAGRAALITTEIASRKLLNGV